VAIGLAEGEEDPAAPVRAGVAGDSCVLRDVEAVEAAAAEEAGKGCPLGMREEPRELVRQGRGPDFGSMARDGGAK
jgi:hypothetical protein